MPDIALFSASGAALYAGGFPARYGFPPGLEASFQRDPASEHCGDQPLAYEKEKDWYCSLGTPRAGAPDFVMFGDSHALSAIPAFHAAAERAGKFGATVSYSGCLPFLGVDLVRANQDTLNCRLMNERVLRFVRENRVRQVFLVARWNYYTVWSGMAKPVGGKAPETPAERAVVFREALARTVAAYNQAGARVVFLSQVPRQLYDAPEIYKNVYLKPASVRAALVRRRSVPLSTHLSEQALVSSIFRDARGDFRFVNLDHDFCDADTCLVGTLTESYYYNEDHLSANGARRIVDDVAAALRAE